MSDARYPGLWSPTISGRLYAYYRADRRAKPVRITAADGSHPLKGDAGFDAAYRRSVRAAKAPPVQPAPAPRSISALILSYKQDGRWTELSPVTQKAYRRRLGMLDARYGVCSAVDLDRPGVIVIQKYFATNGGKPAPSRGNEVVKALNGLIKHSINIGWRRDNPVAGLEARRTGPGYRMWTAAHFATFMAHPEIGEALKRAVVVAYYTGLRISDLVALPRTARQGGVIVWTPGKTKNSSGATVCVPEHPELTRWLDSAPETGATALLTTPTGRPWTKDHLERRMAQAARLAGLGGLSFHGLRKALTARLAEAGATDAQISATVPHSAAMTAYYRKHADQRMLASDAMALLRDRVLAGE